MWTSTRWPKPLFISAACSQVLIVGLIDYLTGMEASVTVLYLLPIGLGAWVGSRRVGITLAIGSALVWVIVERLQGVAYSHALTQWWNALALLGIFVTVVFLLSRLRESYERLDEKVRQRTSELLSEIAVRKEAEANLAQANIKLRESQADLMRTLSDLQKSHAELKATQLQLVQAAKMELIGRLAAGVAHEVKNPLMTIMMGIDYLEKTPLAEEEEVDGVLKDQRQAVDRASAVINELLDLSAPAELHQCPEDLNSIIERAAGLVRHQLAKGRITLVRELDPHLPLLPLDKNKIEQVFVNAFLNAIWAMPEGGALTVRTYSRPASTVGGAAPVETASPSQEEGSVMAEIDDTGTGIAEENLAKVFDPFFTTRGPGKGSGLGLSVVRQIVQIHGGMVSLANRAEGGARFSVKFFKKGPRNHEQEDPGNRR